MGPAGWVSRTAYTLALICVCTGAAAEEPVPSAEPIVFDVEGPAECADGAAFFRAVRARTKRVRETEGKPEERRFRVRFAAVNEGFEGRLSVVTTEHEGAERRIGAKSCAEALDALSLIAALAIDPQASLVPDAEQSPVEPLPAARALPELPPPMPLVVEAPEMDRRATERDTELTEAAPANTARTQLLLGLGLGAEADPGPSVVFPTAAIFAELAIDAERRITPRFRLGLRRSLPVSVESESGAAEFVLTVGRAEACPIRLGGVTGFAFLPCIVFDGGIVEAEGKDVDRAVFRTRPFWAAGAAGRARWAGRGAVLELEIGAIRPLVRDRFAFSPDELVYESADILAYVALGVAFGVIAGEGK
jgi:hypothetical protein